MILALKRLKESYINSYLKRVLGDIILEYEIKSKKTGVFVVNNSSENDPAVKAVLTRFLLNLKDTSGRRGRCLIYIINLTAKDFLYKKNNEVFER